MRVRNRAAVALIALCAVAARPQVRSSEVKPVESEHRAGPNGLDSWTLNSPLPDAPNRGNFPFTLVIAREGKVVRRIEGSPFVWRWVYWNDGREVAYEAGPLHFVMQCNLVDIETGRTLNSMDCFGELPGDAPEWAKALENSK